MWLGISMDEVERVKDGKVKYIKNVYPLLDRNMSRQDCINYLNKHGIPIPPKSACVFCPYQSRNRWEDLIRQDGEDYQKALEIDQKIRDRRPNFKCYIHPSRKPLNEIPVHYSMFDNLAGQSCDSGYCFL